MAKQQKSRVARKPDHLENVHDGGPTKQHPLQHPMHAVGNPDHRHMSMKEKYNETGPHVKMPDHQHELHHPHSDLKEVHKMHMTKEGH